MRYYRIEITDPKNANYKKTFTSFTGNYSDPGALNVELDIPVAPFATPLGGAFVRVWGVSLRDIGQASDLNGKSIRIFGGMQKGLPLANPKQAGLLVQGVINQALGNWQGSNMTLDLFVTVGNVFGEANVNLSVDWRAGTPMSDMIRQTVSTAFPKFKLTININPKLVLAHDEQGFYGSATQFAQYVKIVSQDIIGGNYAGVDVLLRENEFVVSDGTTESTPIVIAFNDLVGQITWDAPFQIMMTTVMRADLSQDSYVKLPPGQVATTAASLSQYRQGSIFQGTYRVNQVRHVGNFRQPDGTAWVSLFKCSQVQPDGG